MKVKFLTMSNDLKNPGLQMLETSLKKFKWDYEIINAKYERFGSKQIAFTEYMKKDKDYTHFFICDAHDVIVLKKMSDVVASIYNEYGVDLILFNAEKACWPFGEWAERYPLTGGYWKYLNGGAAFVEKERYLRMIAENPISHTDNDQVNLARVFLEKRDQYDFVLDTKCVAFQSVAFEGPGDFWTGNGIVKNLIHDTLPGIIHANGKSPIQKYYDLLNG